VRPDGAPLADPAKSLLRPHGHGLPAIGHTVIAFGAIRHDRSADQFYRKWLHSSKSAGDARCRVLRGAGSLRIMVPSRRSISPPSVRRSGWSARILFPSGNVLFRSAPAITLFPPCQLIQKFLLRLLSSAQTGFSRTFDEGGPSPVPDGGESPGKRGPVCRLAALDHRKCGRTANWHLFVGAIWHPACNLVVRRSAGTPAYRVKG
jgi:hypothetical protein